MTRVKICGVRTAEGARAVRDSGADLAGLNFVPTSKRCVSLETARELAALLAPVELVGVFADHPVPKIREVAEALPLAYVQLHGQEPPEVCAELAHTHRVIKAVAVGETFDPGLLSAYRPHVAMFLFDGQKAGSGTPFVWPILTSFAPGLPFLVAGGLTPENVGAVIDMLEPWGVDTASGVERGGAQDPARIGAFVREARRL